MELRNYRKGSSASTGHWCCRHAHPILPIVLFFVDMNFYSLCLLDLHGICRPNITTGIWDSLSSTLSSNSLEIESVFDL